MSLLARRREFLVAYRKNGGSIEAAAAKLGLDPSVHDHWMSDWLYRGAFSEVQKEMKLEAAGKLPPPKPKGRVGRPPKPKPENPPPKRPRGRPPRNPPPPTITEGSPDEPVPVSAPADVPLPPIPPYQAQVDTGPPPPGIPLEGIVEPSLRGYTRLYVKEEELPAVQESERKPPPKEEPPEAPLEITVASDEQQRALIDELGELDRRRQLYATNEARYESLKKAVKNWCRDFPADSDVVMEGTRYFVRVSGCERERKIRDLQEVIERIGVDRVLQIATVPIGELAKLLGTTEIDSLLVETRSGSRRIRCIPKYPAVPPS